MRTVLAASLLILLAVVACGTETEPTTTDTRPPDPNRPITKAPDPGSVEDREQK